MTVLAVLESTLPLLLLVLQNTVPRGNRDSFDGCSGSAVVAVSVVMATPLKPKHTFPTS